MSDQEVIERVWDAPIDLVWQLWTTAEGIGSWWGPGGFTVEVQEFDLQVGGSFTYVMRATSPAMVERMEKMGRPLSHSATATLDTVDPPHTLAWHTPFGTETLSMSVTFSEVDEGVKMVLTLSSTKEGMVSGPAMGWRSSLKGFAERLEQVQASK